MKILMIGLGSIGQRHLRNIKRLYGNKCEILAYRTRRLQRTFSDNMHIRENVELEKEYDIKVYDNLEEALKQKPDVAFITNITSKHMECAIEAARKGCHLFIEKPLSHTLDGVWKLQKIAKQKKIKIFIGFQNRYHICVQEAKKYLDAGIIGNIVHVESKFCERLSTMHRYEDYRDTYMANATMGGGPILNLQIHDLDCLQWLFGKAISVYSVVNKHSALDINVEDFSMAIYQFEKEQRPITAYSITDFYQYPPVHTLSIVGTKGRIEVDFNDAAISIFKGDKELFSKIHENFTRNEMFIRELKDFVSCIENDTEPAIGLEAGITTLNMALAQKQSANMGKKIYIDSIFEKGGNRNEIS